MTKRLRIITIVLYVAVLTICLTLSVAADDWTPPNVDLGDSYIYLAPMVPYNLIEFKVSTSDGQSYAYAPILPFNREGSTSQILYYDEDYLTIDAVYDNGSLYYSFDCIATQGNGATVTITTIIAGEIPTNSNGWYDSVVVRNSLGAIVKQPTWSVSNLRYRVCKREKVRSVNDYLYVGSMYTDTRASELTVAGLNWTMFQDDVRHNQIDGIDQTDPIYIDCGAQCSFSLLPQQEARFYVNTRTYSANWYNGYQHRSYLNYSLPYTENITYTDLESFDYGTWLDDGVGSFFDTPIFGEITFGALLIVPLSIILVVVFLKIFAGG